MGFANPSRMKNKLAIGALVLATAGGCIGNIGGTTDDEAVASNSALGEVEQGQGNLVFAIDSSKWAGEFTDAEMRCWWDKGVRHVIVGTQNRRLTRQQLDKAQEAGMTLDMYVYLYWDNPAKQIEWALEVAKDYPSGRIWIDVEEEPGGRSEAELTKLVTTAFDTCGDFPCGIYTAAWWWKPHMNNSAAFSDKDVWYAYYDNNPSLSTWDKQQFGGWKWPVGKQYNETYVCGLHIDVNTMAVDAKATGPAPLGPDEAGPPSAPTGLYPDGGLQIWTESVRVLCDTEPGAHSYAFDIEHYKNGKWVGYYTYQTSDNARQFDPIFDGRFYRWRVRAEDADGWGAWSQWATFEYGSAAEVPEDIQQPPPVQPPEHPPPDEPPQDPPPAEPPEDPPPPPPPGAPTGCTPTGGAKLLGSSVKMSCDDVAGATKYKFEIQVFNGWDYVAYYTYSSNGSYKTFYPASKDKPYRFRVSTQTKDGWSPQTNWHTFLFGANASLPAP